MSSCTLNPKPVKTENLSPGIFKSSHFRGSPCSSDSQLNVREWRSGMVSAEFPGD